MKSVSWLRERCGIGRDDSKASANDKLAFVFWCFVAVGYHAAWFAFGLAMLWWLTVRALGFAWSALDALVVEGSVKFITIAFFFVPGQLGASESVYTLLFSSMGLPGAVGLTMALVRRVRALVVAAIALGAASAL